MKPTVSICIPTRNRSGLLQEAIDSALDAVGKHAVEIVVLDNASTDGTQALLRKNYGKQKGVKVVRHLKDLGMVGNWNAALKVAAGNKLILLHDDDRLEKHALDEGLHWHGKNPGIAFSFGAFKVRKPGGQTGSPVRLLGNQVQLLRQTELWAWIYRYFSPITAATVMFNTRALKKIGGFRKEAGLAADADAYLRLAAVAPAVYVPVSLALYGFHEENLSHSMTGSGMAESIRYVGDHMALPPGIQAKKANVKLLSRLLQARYAANSSLLHAVKGQFDSARKALAGVDANYPAGGHGRLVWARRVSNSFFGPMAAIGVRIYFALRRRFNLGRWTPARCEEWIRQVIA